MTKLINFIKSPLAIFAGVGALLFVVMAYMTRLGIKMGSKYFMLAIGGLVLIVLLVVGIYFLWKFIEKRRGGKLENELGNQEAQAKQQQRQQAKMAVQDIRQRWADTISTLKASKVKIYDLPWFLLIGEPQSGKTTTLRESGLDFPLGKDALSGAGGTVNCDWWFTNEAVILDTAGRFTMPVDTAPDRQEWHAFLRLLVKYRKRCPINGVVVTIPATSLLQDSDETITDKARNIQEKLGELVKILGVEFPVYIMVSKLDLVYGFAEFCASLSAEERTQALGWNRHDISQKGFDRQEFKTFFDRFVERLHSWSLRRLRDIPAGSESDRVYAFPGEFSRLQGKLQSYLDLIFSQDRYHTTLLLRGCYFSSGLQEGRSIAKALLGDSAAADQGIMAEFAKSFVQSRAYFINIFYRKIFREQGLVTRAGAIAKKETGLRIAAAVIALIAITLTGWMLVSGYHRLLNLVQPIEFHAKKAQTLLLDPNYTGSAQDINEVIAVVESLEHGRQQLMQEGARRFLKTKKNTIVRKLGRIEDALLEQKIFQPMLLAAADNFGKMDPLDNAPEKEKFLNLLMLYLNTESGKEISGKDLEDLIAFVPWGSPAMSAIQRDEAARLAGNYPYGDMPNVSYTKFPGNMFQFREGLGRLQEFWATYYPNLYTNIDQNITSINASYLSLGTMPMRPGDDNSFTRFTDTIDQFTSSIDFLRSIPADDLIWTPAKRVKCFADYGLLQKSLADDLLGDISSLSTTALRHSKTCLKTEQKISSAWTTLISQNSHIIKLDSTLDADMLKVSEALQAAISFGPLFTDKEKDQLEADTSDLVTVLEYWDQAWQNESETEFNKINSMLTSIQSTKWQKEELAMALRGYLRHKVWQSEREATIAAMEAIGKKGAITNARLSPGMDPPQMARAAWLADQFETMQNLQNNLRKRYPAATIGMKPVQNAMNQVMLDSWQECVTFWYNTLIKVDPGATILSTTSWQEFRKEAVSQQGLFFDPSLWPMDAFFDFMSLKDIQQAQEILWNNVNKSLASSTLRSLGDKVEKFAYVYSGNRYLPKLEQAQADFHQAVKQLSDDPITAWQSLTRKSADGTTPLMEGYTAFSTFQQKIERDTISRGEATAGRLAVIEEHGLMLLREKVAAKFQQAWKQFMSHWKNTLQYKYPFGDASQWIINDTIEGNIRVVASQNAQSEELNAFFFSKEYGLEVFAERYGLLGNSADNDSSIHFLSSSQKKFLTKCKNWRDFLFDAQGLPKAHSIEIKIDSSDQLSEQAAALFTQLLFNGLENEQRKTLRLRFSGSRYKQGKIKWDLNTSSIITIEAKNEETGQKTALRLTGGSMAFPSYIASAGHKIKSTRLSHWGLTLKLPETLSESDQNDRRSPYLRRLPGFALVPLNIVMDETLPEPINWP